MEALNADPEAGIYPKEILREREGQLRMHVHPGEEAWGGKRTSPAKAWRCGSTLGEGVCVQALCVHGWKQAILRHPLVPAESGNGWGDTCGLNHGW